MNATGRAVVALLGTALFGRPLELPEQVDWPAVLREMQLQTVAALAAEVVRGLEGVDEAVRAAWVRQAGQSLQRFCHIQHEQQEALGLLGQAGLQAVVLKGAAAAQYYPEPTFRAMGDVDLLLTPEAADQAAALLKEHGYTRVHEEVRYSRHMSLGRNGVSFEIHRAFSTLPDPAKAKALDQLLFEGMKESCCRSCGGYTYSGLPEMHNGLVLLEHVSHHMISGVGLRQMLDWMLYVDRVLDDAFWTSTFQPVARAFGLEKLAAAIGRMGQLYFGLRTQGRSWCLQADEAVCSRLLEFVMDNGNFGMKHGERWEASKVLSDFGSLGGMLRSLQEKGCRNFAAQIKRYPFLRPFAWLMRLGRLAVLGLRRRLNPDDICASYRESRRRVTLLKDLGIGENERPEG